MKQSITALVGALVVASCAAPSQSGEFSSNGLRTYDVTDGLGCAPTLGLLECLRQNEPIVARRQGVELVRSDSEVCLSTKANGRVCLRDEGGVRHTLLERIPDCLVVVETDDAGGFTVLLVSEKTGQRRRIDNRPLFSPDGTIFATVSYDTDAGYVPNRVAIWGSASTAPLYEVDRFESGMGPTTIRWISPLKLEVEYSRSEYTPDGGKAMGTFSIWKDADGSWHENLTR